MCVLWALHVRRGRDHGRDHGRESGYGHGDDGDVLPARDGPGVCEASGGDVPCMAVGPRVNPALGNGIACDIGKVNPVGVECPMVSSCAGKLTGVV